MLSFARFEMKVMPKFIPLFLLIAFAAEVRAADPKPPELALEAYRLPNGLKVALHRDPSVPRVTVCVAYHVGSKNEKAGRTGFAHFFEHMMFRGTKNVPNYDIALQETGAQSNAFTSEDMTVYFETVASNYLERALYLEAERLAFLPTALNQEKFDTEREVVKNERRQSYDNRPYGLDGEAILKEIFPAGHPYSWPVIGSLADLDRASLDDLKQFFAENYHTGNATLCLAGDFDPKETKALIAKYFGPLVAGPKPKGVEVPAVKARASKLVQYDNVQLSKVYWNWPAVGDDHPDAPALELLGRVLAGGETSRLHKVLVLEQGLSTDVSASNDTKESAGIFSIDSTANESEEDPSKALPAIEAAFQAEVDKIKKEAPSQEEVDRALALFEKQSYASLTSPLGRAIVLAMGFSQKDDAAYYKADFARYFKVKPEDVKRVANLYLTPAKSVVWTVPIIEGHEKSTVEIVGPTAKDEEKKLAVSSPPKAGPDWSKMPGASKPKGFETPKFFKKSLANGLEVWVAPWKTLPLVTVQLYMEGGSADDPEGKSGLASLTATLLEQGTKTKTATELAEVGRELGRHVRSERRKRPNRDRFLDGLAQPGTGSGTARRSLEDPSIRSRGLQPRARPATRRTFARAGQRWVDRASSIRDRPLRSGTPLRQPRRRSDRDGEIAQTRRREKLPRRSSRPQGGDSHHRRRCRPRGDHGERRKASRKLEAASESLDGSTGGEGGEQARRRLLRR